MSLFVEGLIARHRESGVEADAVPLVRPRPRARFESDLGLTEFAGDTFENGNAATPPGEFEQETVSLRHDTQLDKEFFSPRPALEIEVTEGMTENHTSSKLDTTQYLVRQPEFRVDHPDNVGIQVSEQSGPSEKKTTPVTTEGERSHHNEKRSVFDDHQPEQPLLDPEQRIFSQEVDDGSKKSSRNNDLEVSSGRESAIDPQPLFDTHEFRQQIQAIQQRLHRQQSGFTDEQPTHHPKQLFGQEGQVVDPASGKAGKVQSEQLRIEGQAMGTEPSSGHFNQRIQEIIQRLHAQQQGQQDGQAVENQGLQEKQIPANTGASSSSEPTETVPNVPKLPVPATKAVSQQQRDGINIPENRPQQPEIQQSALLRPPSWLPEMQADLQRRNQEENSRAQVQSEPVINVSIGRIEVRATQTPSADKPKTHQRPSGVMSLDEYLKQRENRR